MRIWWSSADIGYLTVTDDKILVQLTSFQEGSTAEDKDAYVNGLKQTIHQMRGRKVTDFHTVASEIAAYRTKFLGDSSRVLIL